MKSVAKKFALIALCASALTAVSHTADAAAVLTIENGVVVPTFNYGTASPDNNVVNNAGSGAPVVDGLVTNTTSSTNWLGTGPGRMDPIAYVNVTGLTAGQSYQVNWQYLGSESGDTIRFSTSGLPNHDENDRNNNCAPCSHSSPPTGPAQNLGTKNFVNSGLNIPTFTLTDLQSGGTATNSNLGPNAAPGSGIANMIFAYANFAGGIYTLTNVPTDFVIFGFNDNGANDDNHDDYVGVITLIPGTNDTNTPIPGALPLFGSVLGGGLLFRRLRKRAKSA